MQNNNENSTNNAGSAAQLTTNPGNGKTLRQDATKICDWPYLDDYSPIMPDPVTILYNVNIGNMSVNPEDVIFTNDRLLGEIIPIDNFLPGTYVVNDISGNSIICKITDIEPGRTVRLRSFNPGFKDIYLRRNEIASISRIFRLTRDAMSLQDMEELERLYDDNDLLIINQYLNELAANVEADSLFIINNIDKDRRIPMMGSKQLNPKDMAIEAQSLNTSHERRIQILEAFRNGFNLMKEMDVPAYRILFIETGGKILIEFD